MAIQTDNLYPPDFDREYTIIIDEHDEHRIRLQMTDKVDFFGGRHYRVLKCGIITKNDQEWQRVEQLLGKFREEGLDVTTDVLSDDHETGNPRSEMVAYMPLAMPQTGVRYDVPGLREPIVFHRTGKIIERLKEQFAVIDGGVLSFERLEKTHDIVQFFNYFGIKIEHNIEDDGEVHLVVLEPLKASPMQLAKEKPERKSDTLQKVPEELYPAPIYGQNVPLPGKKYMIFVDFQKRDFAFQETRELVRGYDGKQYQKLTVELEADPENADKIIQELQRSYEFTLGKTSFFDRVFLVALVPLNVPQPLLNLGDGYSLENKSDTSRKPQVGQSVPQAGVQGPQKGPPCLRGLIRKLMKLVISD